MAKNAFVYGGGGRPVRTQFNVQPQRPSLLPQTIADSHSQQQMTAAPTVAAAAPASAFSGAAGGASRIPSFGSGAFSGLQQAAAPAAAPASDGNPNDPFTIIRNLLGEANTAHGGNALTGDYIRNLLRKSAFQRGKNQRRRGEVLARLAGLDPMQQRQAMVDTDRQASSDLTQGLNEADIQGGMSQRDMLLKLLLGERGIQDTGVRDRFAAGEARAQQGGGFGDFLGSALGAGVGALTGGVGASAGNRIGRAIF